MALHGTSTLLNDKVEPIAAKLCFGRGAEAILISDLLRHRVAYHRIGLISRRLTRSVMTRVDAPLSVRRAYTPQEWRELFQRAGIGPFRISPMFPFRQLTVIRLGG